MGSPREIGVAQRSRFLTLKLPPSLAALKQLILRDTARLLVKEGAAELVRRGVGVGVAGGADSRARPGRQARGAAPHPQRLRQVAVCGWSWRYATRSLVLALCATAGAEAGGCSSVLPRDTCGCSSRWAPLSRLLGARPCAAAGAEAGGCCSVLPRDTVWLLVEMGAT